MNLFLLYNANNDNDTNKRANNSDRKNGWEPFFEPFYSLSDYKFKCFSLTYKPNDINKGHMISGIRPSTPYRISTSSYFTTPTMTMTKTRGPTTDIDRKGEKYFLSLQMWWYIAWLVNINKKSNKSGLRALQCHISVLHL